MELLNFVSSSHLVKGGSIKFMHPCNSSNGRVRLCLPDCFLVPPIKPKEPPPVPGTVTPEDVRPPLDPPLPFLLPWAPHRRDPLTILPLLHEVDRSIPCEVDVEVLHKFTERHSVRATVEAVFKGHPEETKIAYIEGVVASLASPFSARATGGEHEQIVWTLHRAVRKNPAAYQSASGGKKSIHRHDRLLRGPPWSIVSFGEELAIDVNNTAQWPGMIKRNMIYDGNGDAVAQVDFGHGEHIGIHCHALVVGALDHAPGTAEDHMFALRSVPWFWLSIPDVRSARLLKRLEGAKRGSTVTTMVGRSQEEEDADDASDVDELDQTANVAEQVRYVSRDDITGGRHSAAVFDRQRGARWFGLPCTRLVDGCGWTAINVSYDDYGEC